MIKVFFILHPSAFILERGSMAGLDLTTCEAKLAEYLAAESAVLAGQRITLTGVNGGRDLTRADLAAIQQGITLWNTRVQQLARTATGGRGFRCIESAA
jgi:hypothetical protein